MDNLTHSLFAVTLGRTHLGRAGRGTTAALVIASNIPDIDILATARGSVSYLQWHRGPTHGPLSIVGLGVLTAGLVRLWLRFRDRRDGAQAPPSASFPILAAISMIGVTLHLTMDLPTSYGTRLLSPFDWHWFALDWLPIIDIYLLAALGAGLLVGAASPASRRRSAAIVIAVMAANYGVRAAAHHQALVIAPGAFETPLPDACRPVGSVQGSPHESPRSVFERWPTDAAMKADTPAGRCLVEIAAMPTFLSPFTWRVIARLSDEYEIRDINLLDARFGFQVNASRHVALRFPNQWNPAVMKAAESRLGQLYLGFSRFPAARAFIDPTGAATVRWNDMRFVGGPLTLSQPTQRPDPFMAMVRIDSNGRIVDERFGP